MDVAVIGGDMRHAYLARLLCDAGLDARAAALEGAALPGLRHMPLESLEEAETLVLNSPPQAKLTGKSLDLAALLRLARPGARCVFTGPQAAPTPDRSDLRVHDLTQDEVFLRRNAALTAEGAIYAAMCHLPDALADARCLVIGWGRIGRALTERVVALGADVTVASRGESGRRQALARGARAADTARLGEALEQADVVFSTPPAPVLDAEALRHLRPEALALDLASPPYGVDLAAAAALGRNAWREPGLPGRYCPRSAARVLAERILPILGAERGPEHA